MSVFFTGADTSGNSSSACTNLFIKAQSNGVLLLQLHWSYFDISSDSYFYNASSCLYEIIVFFSLVCFAAENRW